MTLAGLAIVALLAQSSNGAEVRGRLLSGESRAPVVGVNVTLLGSGAPSATTDEAGRFVIRQIQDGHYTLLVFHGPKMFSEFGGSSPKEVAVDVIANTRLDLGDVLLPAGVVVTGVVLDERGHPLPGAFVNVWRLAYFSPGDRFLSHDGEATSDAAGGFRIVGMKPGTYLVSARETETSAHTYFPAVTNARLASPVRVSLISGAAGISIQLLSIPLTQVSGAVVDSAGAPSVDSRVRLCPVTDDGAQHGLYDLNAGTDSTGRFSIGKVPPGTYDVAVLAKAPAPPSDEPPGLFYRVANEESGILRIVVDGRPIDDALVRTEPPVRLSGRVTLDGAPLSAELVRLLRVSAGPYARGGSGVSQLGSMSAKPTDGGDFSALVVRGRYSLGINFLLGNLRVHHVLVDGVDVTDDGFEVGGMEIRDAVIALTSKPSRVGGHVTNAQGAALPNVKVVVFPSDERRWQLPDTRLIKSTTSEKDGAFVVVGLPPGNYLAVVVSRLADGEWAEPSNLEALRRTATPFTLGDGEQKTMVLTLRR